MFKVGIITASDKCSRGEREDTYGPLIGEIMARIGGEIEAYAVVPDSRPELEAKLTEYADEKHLDLILTIGWTGLGPRDITPEATLAVIDRAVPGIAEAMRWESLKVTPRAMLSRAVAGIRGRSLIINLPGSPKAVKECLEVILPALPHGLEILKGTTDDCAEVLSNQGKKSALYSFRGYLCFMSEIVIPFMIKNNHLDTKSHQLSNCWRNYNVNLIFNSS